MGCWKFGIGIIQISSARLIHNKIATRVDCVHILLGALAAAHTEQRDQQAQHGFHGPSLSPQVLIIAGELIVL